VAKVELEDQENLARNQMTQQLFDLSSAQLNRTTKEESSNGSAGVT